jgi:hypothetical protein
VKGSSTTSLAMAAECSSYVDRSQFSNRSPGTRSKCPEFPETSVLSVDAQIAAIRRSAHLGADPRGRVA